LTSSGAGNQSYAYHDADDLAQITETSSTLKQAFDDASQLTTISDASDTRSPAWNYSPQGDRTALTSTTGTATSYSYDQANQLTEYRGPTPPGAPRSPRPTATTATGCPNTPSAIVARANASAPADARSLSRDRSSHGLGHPQCSYSCGSAGHR
jgi:YD repeat-containing protein